MSAPTSSSLLLEQQSLYQSRKRGWMSEKWYTGSPSLLSLHSNNLGTILGTLGTLGGCETPVEPKIEESHLEKWLYTHGRLTAMVLVIDLETVLFPCRFNYSFSCPRSCQCHMPVHDLVPASLIHGLGSVLPTQDPAGDTLLHCVPRGRPADLGSGCGPEGALWLGSRKPKQKKKPRWQHR